jgi:hypothetical protein
LLQGIAFEFGDLAEAWGSRFDAAFKWRKKS